MTFEEIQKALQLVAANQQLMDKNLTHHTEILDRQLEINKAQIETNKQTGNQIAELGKRIDAYIRHLKNGGSQ